jgi:hypothetical protein
MVVAEDGGRILAFTGLCPEEAENTSEPADRVCGHFQGIERYVRAFVDRDGA